MRRLFTLLASLTLTTLCSGQELTERSFDKWAAYLAPGVEECSWEGVPWRQSFREGIRDSQIDGRPILLWAMNGHPMGCV